MKSMLMPPAAAPKQQGLTIAAGAGPKRRRILLVEDHPIVSQGLAELINYEKDLQVCGIAEDADAALQKIEFLKPELVVLDITLRGHGGLQLLRQLKSRYRGQRVLMLSMHDEALYAPRAIRLGASGYVMKQEATLTLLSAIRHVLQGGSYVSERMAKKLRQQGRRGRNGSALDPVEMLSARESEIFSLIGRGKRTGEIARELSLSPKTVETHRGHIKEKLGLKSATELIRYAVEMEHEASA